MKGAKIRYTSLNGHTVSYLPRGEVALRLPAEELEKFLKKHQNTLFEAYLQKENVTVPDALLKKTRELANYFELSWRYVVTLKPTKKKR